MGYTVVFDEATADYDFTRKPKLLLTHSGSTAPVAIESTTGYDAEVRHLLGAIAEGRRELVAMVGDAIELTRMLERERDALLDRGSAGSE
jgi:hypothetical protein